MLFDDYMRTHRQAEELLKQHESKTVEFKSTLRWNVKEERKDPKLITHSVLKTIAAFLNSEGGDLLIGVADDRTVPGIAADRLENDDKYLLHLSHVAAQGLGDRAGTLFDVFPLEEHRLRAALAAHQAHRPVADELDAGIDTSPEGDFFVRIGAQTKKLSSASTAEYVCTRFPSASVP